MGSKLLVVRVEQIVPATPALRAAQMQRPYRLIEVFDTVEGFRSRVVGESFETADAAAGFAHGLLDGQAIREDADHGA